MPTLTKFGSGSLKAFGGTAINKIGDLYWNNVTLLLNGDDLVDHSISPKTINNVNGTSVNTTTKKYGTGSYLFNSTSSADGNLLSVTSFSFSTVFTLEFWMYPSSNKTSHNDGVFSYGSGFSIFGIAYGDSNGSNINFRTGGTAVISGGTFAVNNWYHIAVVRNSSNILTMYVNGVSQGSYTESRTLSATKLIIGSYGDPQFYAFGGYIDDFRVTNGIARYTSNFTPPTATFPTSA